MSDILDAKLESLKRCLDRITTKTPANAEALVSDFDAQDVISVNLQRAVQICVDIGSYLISARGWLAPATMSETFSVLASHGVLRPELANRMRRAVGFRNVSVHEYDEIDWTRVFVLATNHLGDFRLFAEQISESWDVNW